LECGKEDDRGWNGTKTVQMIKEQRQRQYSSRTPEKQSERALINIH
jgi:hypothetical protein